MKILRRQKGAAAVELGLLLIPLTVLTFGISEYGRAIYQYNAVTKAVRDGARYLSQYAPGDATRIAQAKCLTAYGNTNCQGLTLLPNLDITNVTVRDRTTDSASYNLQATGRGTVNLVAVEVAGYTFNSLVPYFVQNMVFGTVRATMLQVL